MDWTQWGKGEERAQSSAGCKILEAPLIRRLRASVNVSWHNEAGSELKENSPVISLLCGSATVLFLLLLMVSKKRKAPLCCRRHVCRVEQYVDACNKFHLNIVLGFPDFFKNLIYVMKMFFDVLRLVCVIIRWFHYWLCDDTLYLSSITFYLVWRDFNVSCLFFSLWRLAITLFILLFVRKHSNDY